MRTTIIILIAFCLPSLHAQTAGRVPVATLGTFHFNFPNLDARQVEREDQIDVLEPRYQAEIEEIVRRLAAFRPTIIVIERQPGEQAKVDSLYRAYLDGAYGLSRREDEQIGFRLGKACGVKRLQCVDEWGVFTDTVAGIVGGRDSAATAKFEWYYFHNPDSAKKTAFKPEYKSLGIRQELLRANDPERIRKSLGDYLTGIFKYETGEGDFLGVDFETGRWFNRNLRILRNIQRIAATPDDRILVIFGAGHLNLLNYFFECSPEFELRDIREYLE